jgi:hypothetical protein
MFLPLVCWQFISSSAGGGGSAESRPANDDTPLACDYSLLFYISNNKRTFAGGEIDYTAVSTETAQVQRLGQRPTPAAAELGLFVAN